MSTGRALYEAILANPDDDLPRLVYADWLEEGGKPDTAAFIRVQCELARVPRWHPLWITARYADRSWLTGKGRNPHDPFPRTPHLGAGWLWDKYGRYRRGFASRIEAMSFGWQAKSFQRLLTRAPIDGLTVCDTRYFLARLFTRPELRQLRSLTLEVMKLGAEHLRALVECPFLGGVTDLRLPFGVATAEVLAAVFASPLVAGLRELRLGWNDTDGPDGLTRGLAGFAHPHLERLDLRHNRIDIRRVLDGVHLPKLVRLDLESCGLGDTAGGLSGWAGCRGITHLDLSNNQLTPRAVRGLAAGPWHNLRVLRLEACNLTPAAVRSLAEAKWLPELRVLDLYRCKITAAGLRVLVKSPGVRNLRCLNMDGNYQDDTVAKMLLDSPHLTGPLCLKLLPHLIRPDLREKLRERFGPEAFQTTT